jgi:hypothetical protein
LFGATLAFAVTALGCGDGIGDITSGGPSATPTPAPTATPVPTPAPTATPTANATCQLARLPNCDAQCCREGGSVIHRAELDAAQNSLRNRRPDLYLSNGDVRDNFQWMQVLAQEILNNTNGRVCAEPLGHDEIRVKSDQSVSQHVDVLISDRTPWVGGAYTCRPASF